MPLATRLLPPYNQHIRLRHHVRVSALRSRSIRSVSSVSSEPSVLASRVSLSLSVASLPLFVSRAPATSRLFTSHHHTRRAFPVFLNSPLSLPRYLSSVTQSSPTLPPTSRSSRIDISSVNRSVIYSTSRHLSISAALFLPNSSIDADTSTVRELALTDKMTTPGSPQDVMVIKEVTPGVTTATVPFLRFGKIKFGGRATIVRLPSNNLAVFSPVALTDVLKKHLTTLGSTVTYLVAPDIEHHIFLSTWAAAYPDAHIIVPEGLPEKRAEMNGKDKSVTILKFGTIFTKAAKVSPEGIKVTPEFDEAFHHEFVDAHPNKELVFVHKQSKTLVTADLMFNLPANEAYSKTGESATSGIFTKLFNALENTKGSAIWQKRMIWYAFSSSDRPSFNASLQKISGWEFQNVIPCHGDSLVGNGKEIWEKVFSWHLVGKK